MILNKKIKNKSFLKRPSQKDLKFINLVTIILWIIVFFSILIIRGI